MKIKLTGVNLILINKAIQRDKMPWERVWKEMYMTDLNTPLVDKKI